MRPTDRQRAEEPGVDDAYEREGAADGGEAQPFEPRKEVPVVEPKVRKKEQMKVTLLEGETPQEAMARLRSAEIEAARLEALALIAETAPF